MFNGSPRAKRRLWQSQYTCLGCASMGDLQATLLLGLVYCIINPIIAPFARLLCIRVALRPLLAALHLPQELRVGRPGLGAILPHGDPPGL